MKIAIVGGAPSSEKLAPFDDPEWEIWVLAIRHQRYSRFDRVFEVHDCYDKWGQEHVDRLLALTKPLVAGEKFPDAPHVVRFDFHAANQLLGREYLTSSLAYMMANAILEIQEKGDEENEIGIYGVDMSVDDAEYFHQQPCMNAWVGYAKGLGIKVTIPEESSLFKSSYTYGREEIKKNGPFTSQDFDELRRQHEYAVSVLTDEIRERERKITGHSGAAEAYRRMTKVARSVEGGQIINRLRDTAIIKL